MTTKHSLTTLEKIVNNKLVIFIFLFIILFGTFNFIRFSTNNAFPDDLSYVFLNNLNDYKTFQVEGVNVFYEIILELSFIINENLAAIIIMMLVWIINIIIFNDICDRLIKDKTEQVIINILLLFSSILIASSMIFSYFPIIITILLWIIRSSIKTPKLTFIPLIAALLINFQLFIASFITAIIIYLLMHFFKHSNLIEIIKLSDYIKLNIFIPLFAFLASYFLKISSSELIVFSGFKSITPALSYVVDFSLVYIALAIISLFLVLKNKKITLITILLFFIAIFNVYARILFSFLCIFLASKGFVHLIKRNWFVKELKKPTIMLVVLLIMFYVITQSEELVNSEPTQQTMSDIKNINTFISQDMTSQKILMDNEDIKFFKYFANLSIYYSADTEIVNFTLENSNYKKMNEFFTTQNISHIYISDRVLNKRWTRSDKGILLLLTQSDSFIQHNITTNSIFYTYKRNQTLTSN